MYKYSNITYPNKINYGKVLAVLNAWFSDSEYKIKVKAARGAL